MEFEDKDLSGICTSVVLDVKALQSTAVDESDLKEGGGGPCRT